MTAVPRSSQPSPKVNGNPKDTTNNETTPVLALKELVESLHREQNKIQNLLSSLGFALRSFNNLNQFLELTPLIAARVTDAEGGALVLWKQDGMVRLEQLHCHDSQVCQNIRPILEEITRKVANLKFNSNLEANGNEDLSSSLDEQIKSSLGTVQMFGTPILVKNVERGRLYAFSSNKDYLWTQTRRKLLQLVADQTAVAIANNELTVELRSKERTDRELEIASEIQLQLLPRKCPEIEGVEMAARCKTANKVGGDYYDFIRTDYDRTENNKIAENNTSVPWSIAIGDVMGKGVPAGLIMTMTRGMLRAEVLNRNSPGRILEHLNRVMYSDLENSGRFVTLFYSEYNPSTRILSYSNAVHNPPLLWQAKTKTIQQLDAWGMLIGLDRDSKYEDAKIQLAPGDTLVYYTDGFTDAVDRDGQRFGEERLFAAVKWAVENCSSAAMILDYLFNLLEEFSGNNNSNGDDMTLVVMKVKAN
ncbi:MAG: GAF domain-containing SpoIIE family protein phosphatase [Prochloraceae cyanobacterium]